MKEICFRLPVENIILLFLSTLHLSQVTHLCIVHMHNIHPSVLLRYKCATSCVLAAVMQAVKHEIIFLYFCYTLCLCVHSGSAITDLKVQPFFCLPLIFHCVVDYTRCPRRNVPNFGRVFLMLKYTDITQNTYIQS